MSSRLDKVSVHRVRIVATGRPAASHRSILRLYSTLISYRGGSTIGNCMRRRVECTLGINAALCSAANSIQLKTRLGRATAILLICGQRCREDDEQTKMQCALLVVQTNTYNICGAGRKEPPACLKCATRCAHPDANGKYVVYYPCRKAAAKRKRQ